MLVISIFLLQTLCLASFRRASSPVRLLTVTQATVTRSVLQLLMSVRFITRVMSQSVLRSVPLSAQSRLTAYVVKALLLAMSFSFSEVVQAVTDVAATGPWEDVLEEEIKPPEIDE